MQSLKKFHRLLFLEREKLSPENLEGFIRLRQFFIVCRI
jgi:hypothetical protein